MRGFHETMADALRTGSCLLLVLSRPVNRDQRERSKLTLRPVIIGGVPQFQLTSQHANGEMHENLSADEAVSRIETLLGRQFLHGHLFTPDGDYSARVRPDGTMHVKRRPPSKAGSATAHNRRKQHLIPEGEPCGFLVELGVMTPAGKVRASRTRKFRQINRFLELVNDAVESLPNEDDWYVVDFGCGKSYLTFALHHLFARIRMRPTRLVGLDRNAGVVQQCLRLAERLDCPGLEFQIGDIAAFQPDRHVDLAICLHACDVATDDAIAKAVAWQADVILAVPCCQHEIADKVRAAELQAVTGYGILKERFAAIATDALRALALEICDYKTQVVEFIDLEHTAKNVLIRAIRRRSAHNADKAVSDYRRLKESLGLKRLHLERALGSAFMRRVDA